MKTENPEPIPFKAHNAPPFKLEGFKEDLKKKVVHTEGPPAGADEEAIEVGKNYLAPPSSNTKKDALKALADARKSL